MKAVGAKIPDKDLSLLKMLLVQTIVENVAGFMTGDDKPAHAV